MSASGLKLTDTTEREGRFAEARRLMHVATVFLQGNKPTDAANALAQALAILRGMKP